MAEQSRSLKADLLVKCDNSINYFDLLLLSIHTAALAIYSKILYRCDHENS